MRFAEVTQEVMVDRPETVKKQVGLAPGRHRGNNNYLVYIHNIHMYLHKILSQALNFLLMNS